MDFVTLRDLFLIVLLNHGPKTQSEIVTILDKAIAGHVPYPISDLMYIRQMSSLLGAALVAENGAGSYAGKPEEPLYELTPIGKQRAEESKQRLAVLYLLAFPFSPTPP